MDSYGEYDCLFAHTPLYTTETCDDWIDICLSHFKCKTYLFVVDNTEKYKDHIIDEIINKGYNKKKDFIIKINK